MSSNLTKRQLQIARRRKIRQIETRRDQALLKRDQATNELKKLRGELAASRQGA